VFSPLFFPSPSSFPSPLCLLIFLWFSLEQRLRTIVLFLVDWHTGRFFFSFCVFFFPQAARLFGLHEEVEFWRICFPLPPQKGWELSGFENRRGNSSREVAYFVALKMCW
jgi:hypothetical protein